MPHIAHAFVAAGSVAMLAILAGAFSMGEMEVSHDRGPYDVVHVAVFAVLAGALSMGEMEVSSISPHDDKTSAAS
jgi:hypothetical protein